MRIALQAEFPALSHKLSHIRSDDTTFGGSPTSQPRMSPCATAVAAVAAVPAIDRIFSQPAGYFLDQSDNVNVRRRTIPQLRLEVIAARCVNDRLRREVASQRRASNGHSAAYAIGNSVVYVWKRFDGTLDTSTFSNPYLCTTCIAKPSVT